MFTVTEHIDSRVTARSIYIHGTYITYNHYRQTDRKQDRQTGDRQTDRQKGRQTD